jgi:HAD superfamily hydrolase (TIGR01509 family)
MTSTDDATLMPAAVLWDMDGTIVDTEPYWITAEMELAELFGATWTHDDGIAVVGNGLPFTAQRMIDRGVQLEIDEIVQSLTSRVLEQLEVSVPWRPGAVELITELAEAGIPQALVTMSIDRMARTVASLVPGKPLSVVVSGDKVLRSKPDPEAYLLAADQLGVDIFQCVAVEDSPIGVTSASRAGAVTIGVTHLVSLDDAPAHLVLPSLSGFYRDDLARAFTQNIGASS